MKKSSLLTVGLIVISIGLLNAQTTQGKFLLALSSNILDLGYTTSKSKSDRGADEPGQNSFNINLSPTIGYFVIDNLALGLGFSVGMQIGKNEDYTLITTDIGPFARYYVPTSKVLPFLELGGSIGSINFDSDHKMSISKYGGGIGLAAPLGERCMADILVGYRSTIMKDKVNNEDNQRTVMGNLGLEIGFTILLGSN